MSLFAGSKVQFSTGFGDYTSERDTLFRGLTMDEILSEIGRAHRCRPIKRIQATRGRRRGAYRPAARRMHSIRPTDGYRGW